MHFLKFHISFTKIGLFFSFWLKSKQTCGLCLAAAKKEKGDKNTGYCGYISETLQRAELSRETSARRGELHTRAEAGLCLKLFLYQSQRFDLRFAKKNNKLKKKIPEGQLHNQYFCLASTAMLVPDVTQVSRGF